MNTKSYTKSYTYSAVETVNRGYSWVFPLLVTKKQCASIRVEVKTCKSQLCVFSFCHSFQIWRNWLDRTSLRFVTNRKNKESCFFLKPCMATPLKRGWKMHCLKKKTKQKVKFPSGFTGCCCYQSRRGKLHFSASEYIFSSSGHQPIFRHEIFIPIFTTLDSNFQLENWQPLVKYLIARCYPDVNIQRLTIKKANIIPMQT